MMTIDTGKGDFFARHMIPMQGKDGARLLIELEGAEMAQAVAAFDGAYTLTVKNDAVPGMTATYEGYTRIAAASKAEDGHVRITIAREE